MYVFIKTTGSSRCNIHAGFDVFDKDTLIRYIKSDKKGWGQLRYAKINGGGASLLSHMTLKEFEECFEPDTFTREEITRYFRKEISEKYGKHAVKATLPRISKKDLEIGRAYKVENGDIYYYLGRCKGIFYEPAYKMYYSWSSPERKREFEGYYFPRAYRRDEGFTDKTLEDKLVSKYRTGESSVYYPDCIKSIKKFVEKLDHKIEVPRHFEHKDSSGRILKIEFLDVEV